MAVLVNERRGVEIEIFPDGEMDSLDSLLRFEQVCRRSGGGVIK